MKTILSTKLLVLLSCAGAASAFASESDSVLLARGRYLVENVGMCADCHSPRGAKGAFIPGKEFSGSPLGFAPTVPMPAWADTAPYIAGLPNYTNEQAVKFLMTGERPTGAPIRPPMPEYRFNQADAEAIVAYLKTFAPKTQF
jgi:mono/diheme cytochrome c family protein